MKHISEILEPIMKEIEQEITLVESEGVLAIKGADFAPSWIKDIERFPTLHGKWTWDAENEKSISSIKNAAGEYHASELGYKNGWGEYQSCTWKGGEFDEGDLAIALFDAREMGIIQHTERVTLPNGESFTIDADYGQDEKLSADWSSY
tara:strand:- start:196 stop:642 length:447 start_codon:yes stop_codon:yes gene_type:complete